MGLVWVLVPWAGSAVAVTVWIVVRSRQKASRPTPAELGDLLERAGE